jgi:transposase
MSRRYSLDLRTRLVECVEAGASRHEAAERFEVSVRYRRHRPSQSPFCRRGA